MRSTKHGSEPPEERREATIERSIEDIRSSVDLRDRGLDHVVNELASLSNINEWMLPGLL